MQTARKSSHSYPCPIFPPGNGRHCIEVLKILSTRFLPDPSLRWPLIDAKAIESSENHTLSWRTCTSNWKFMILLIPGIVKVLFRLSRTVVHLNLFITTTSQNAFCSPGQSKGGTRVMNSSHLKKDSNQWGPIFASQDNLWREWHTIVGVSVSSIRNNTMRPSAKPAAISVPTGLWIKYLHLASSQLDERKHIWAHT